MRIALCFLEFSSLGLDQDLPSDGAKNTRKMNVRAEKPDDGTRLTGITTLPSPDVNVQRTAVCAPAAFHRQYRFTRYQPEVVPKLFHGEKVKWTGGVFFIVPAAAAKTSRSSPCWTMKIGRKCSAKG